MTGPVNVMHRTPHIFQGDENYCWAAALAMARGGRTIDDAFAVVDRVAAAGVFAPGAEANLPRGAAARAIRAAGLQHAPGSQAATLDQLVGFLRRGPCALFVQLRRAAGSNHSHVLTLIGARGDGTDAGTTLHFNDPYQSLAPVTATHQTFRQTTVVRIDHVGHR